MKIRVLFVDGVWQLIDRTWGNNYSTIQHHCLSEARGTQWHSVFDNRCARCLNRPPEAMIGLKILTDWER